MNNKIKLSFLASIILATNINALENVKQDAYITVTSATKSEQSIQDITSNVEVITGAELESKHITSVLDALKLTGISLTQSGGLGQTSSFFMGGMSAEHTLIMVDGIRYNDPTVTNGYALLDQLMVSNIDRIEIINGAQSGVWGADAAAGVINIITKEETKNSSLNLNFEAGSFDTEKTTITMSGKDKNNNIAMSLFNIKSDGFTAMAPKGEDIGKYENDKYENLTINLKYGFNIDENNKLKFSHTIIDAKGDYDSSFATDPGNDTSSKYEALNTFTSLNFNHVDSFQKLDIYKKRTTFDRKVGSGEYVGYTKEIGFKSHIPYNKEDFIIVGADKKDQIMDKSYSTLRGEYQSKGLFLTNSNKFFDNIILTESIRHDNFDQFKNKNTGKIGIKYFPKNISDLSLSLNYGTAYKTPSLYNLYAGFGSGNINLIPENITSKDAILQYKDLKLKYFSSTIDDEILYSNNTFSYYQSTKQSNYHGYQLSYKKNILKDFLVNFNYLSQSAQDEDGKDLQRRINKKLNFGVDYFGVKKLHINLNGEYVGSRYDDLAQTKQTGKYTVFNAVTNYKINRMFSTYLKINNLTDKKYQTVDGYATSPRAFYVGLNAKF